MSNQPSQIAVSTCCTCGYSWQTRTNGNHSCEKYLTIRAEKAEAACAEMVPIEDVKPLLEFAEQMHRIDGIMIPQADRFKAKHGDKLK